MEGSARQPCPRMPPRETSVLSQYGMTALKVRRPRARREDEVTEAGADPSTYNLFVVCAAIGVSSLPFCARVNLCLAPCSDETI